MSIVTEIYEEAKNGLDCLEKHKQQYKECINGTKKGKSCKNCNKASIKGKEKYWSCPVCDFDLCFKCYKQNRIGSLFLSPPSQKRTKFGDCAPGVEKTREK